MTDGPKYDPDRMNVDDLDPHDQAAWDAWFDHPNTIALHEDLGRAFQHEPVEVQRHYLERGLRSSEEQRNLALDSLKGEVTNSLEVRRMYVEMFEQADTRVRQYKERLARLNEA